MVTTTTSVPGRKETGTIIQEKYLGEVVYIFAFDVAYEMSREPVPQLLGQPLVQFRVDGDKRTPRQLFFYRPQMMRLPPTERRGPHGPTTVQFTIKLLPVGAISILVQVPFRISAIQELVAYHDLQFENGSLQDEVQQLAERVRHELSAYYIRPTAHLASEEAYTVFCLESPFMSQAAPPLCAQDWLQAHRREVAALLTQETETDQLSPQEAEESTSRFLSYYNHDLVVVDWDAALVIDERSNFEETLYLMELANLQLAELAAYDQILDESLERAYRDLRHRPLRRRSNMLRELREIRIDLARFSDEMSNITKFFGDWHLARLYEAVSSRFHLADWRHTIDDKLKTLDDLYQILQHEKINRWMLLLEMTIVLLFIIDLLLLFLGLNK